MGPRDGNHAGSILPLVCLPEQRVAFHVSPSSRCLACDDLEVQMRPPAGVGLFTQRADPLPGMYSRTGLDSGIDRLEMPVELHPPEVVAHGDTVVARPQGFIYLHVLESGCSRRDHDAISRRQDVLQPFGTSDIEARVVVDRLSVEALAAVHVDGFVGHLRARCEPALPERIDQRTRLHERRASRPYAQPRVFLQRPEIPARVAVVVFGYRAVRLRVAHGHREVIVAAGELPADAVDFHRNPRDPHCDAGGIARMAYIQ